MLVGRSLGKVGRKCGAERRIERGELIVMPSDEMEPMEAEYRTRNNRGGSVCLSLS